MEKLDNIIEFEVGVIGWGGIKDESVLCLFEISGDEWFWYKDLWLSILGL